MPKRKRSFEVLIEAKLSVQAFDRESARRKVERALAAGRTVDTDVTSSGQVWVYENDATPIFGGRRA